MKRRHTKLGSLFAAVVLMVSYAGSGAVFAQLRTGIDGSTLLTLSVIPASATVSIGQGSNIPARWRVVAPGYAGATFTSAEGFFKLPDGTVLDSIRHRLSQTVTGAAEFTETVAVPQDVVSRAHRLGSTSLSYVRTFSNGKREVAASMTLNIAGGLGGEFAVSRIELRFPEGTVLKTVSEGAALVAVARIGASGSGVMSAVWEIADPMTTGGAPSFRTLGLVTRGLAGGQVEVESPLLPASLPGVHLVRFRVTSPDLGDSAPVLQYFVARSAPGRQLPAPSLLAIAALSPAPRGKVALEGRLSWGPLEGSRAYQVEIYRTPEDLVAARPLTGAIVPGDREEAALTRLVGERLLAGATYWWRVVSIGPDGGVIGRSEPREMVFEAAKKR